MKRFHRIALALTLFLAAGIAGVLLSQNGLSQNQRRSQTRDAPNPSAPAPAPAASAQAQPEAQPQQPGAPANQPAPESQATLPAQNAQKAGFTTCLAALDASTREMLPESAYSAATTWNNQGADGSSFVTVLSIERPQTAAILTVSPSKSGGCDTSSAAVAYFLDSCIAVREARLQGWKLVWETKTLLGYQAPDSHIAYLMPSGNGCTVIETRVKFGAAVPERN